jgi:ribonuclease HI
LRDHEGRFVAAETTWLAGSYSIMEGEALALHEALKAMHIRGISQVVFESDAKSVVDALHYYRGGNSEFSLLIGHINNLLLSSPNFSVKFIKRQANMVAHTLARVAVSWPSRCSFETLPLCIQSILMNEMI